jgi:WD40 repeat protein
MVVVRLDRLAALNHVPNPPTEREVLDIVWSVCFSSDGKHIASGSRDTTVKLWNASTGELQSAINPKP